MSEYPEKIAPQHSLGWYRARLGRITGSCVGKLMGHGVRDDFTQTGMAYLRSVIAERLLSPDITDDDTNLSIYLDEVSTSSRAMRTGTEREPEARELYSELRGTPVIEVGCIPHPDIDGFASSPDGIIPSPDGAVIGIIEIKCPRPATYVEYLSIQNPADLLRINPDYYWQCHSHIAVTGAAWCDFVTYCPYLIRPLHIVRIPRNNEAIAQLSNRISMALRYINATVRRAIHPEETPVLQPSSETIQQDDMQRIGNIDLSDNDYDFIIEALGKMLPHYPQSDRLLEKNFRRKVSLLTDKLKRKRITN